MKSKYLLISLVAATIVTASPISIEKIVVNSTQDDETLFISDVNISETQNSQKFSQKSIATLSTHANMNPYTVTQFSPSVNFSPVDAAGSNEPSYHDPIRIRGKSQSGPGGVYMINGMPLSSNPGGGKEMVDMENISSIDLLKGYLPVDKNLGFSSLIGKVDMNILAPSKKMETTVSQSFGADNFERTFVRFDSGKMGDIAVFGSVSNISNEKTKGDGELKRYNLMTGLSYEPSENFKADIYAIKNHDEHNNYYSLSYAETQNLGSFYGKDFGKTKPTSSNDVNYFDWNKQKFDTTNVFADITIKPSSQDTITIKPYYKKDEGGYWFTKTDANASKNRVMDWDMNHDLFGAVASYDHTFSEELKSKIGYWYHKQLPPGPPSDQSKYKVVNGDLVFDGYAVLAKNDYHTTAAPFAELSGTINKFNYSAGVQYQKFEVGSIKSYTNGTSATSSVDYDTAIAKGTLDPWASVDAKTFNTLLPSFYLGYALNDNTSIYTNYSRTYGFDVNLFPTYLSNRATFVQKGATLQHLWDKLNLETSDNIDLGVKTEIGGIILNPSLFVSFVKNKQANAYDAEYGVNYPANVGDAFGYGAEFSANGPINENLEFLLGLSYNKYAFTQDFKTGATTSTAIKGNQLPDAPEFMVKTALSYSIEKWTFTPSARYTSSRYGDVANTQTIDAFTIIDFDISFKAHPFMGSKSTVFRATATNLTNEKYIAIINSADNALAADGTSSTYQTGAPMGMFFSANLKY
ncbi:MAG: TonB-dependent receptor [Campylobacterales bacterium]|nr:TonB-dependent receptor [Campylobacterales bacterium]